MNNAEVTANPCGCEQCQSYISSIRAGEDDCQSLPSKYLVKFPEFRYTEDNHPMINYFKLVIKHSSRGEYRLVDTATQSKTREEVQNEGVISIVTYLPPHPDDKVSKDLCFCGAIFASDQLYGEDLQSLLTGRELARDFLRKVCCLFVQYWHAYTNGCKAVEANAWKLRRFLAHIVSFPVIAGDVLEVLFNKEYWPEVNPLQILEKLCEKFLFCVQTASLLCNLTRIDGVAAELAAKTECVKLIKDQFRSYCSNIRNKTYVGEYLLHLLVNITPTEGFTNFVIESSSGQFMKVILPDLLTNADISDIMRNAIWPYLRNISITDEGRQFIVNNMDIYLGPILYPIAGPEQIEQDVMEKLPTEVQYLPECKTRVDDFIVKTCILDILYSLCRFRKDREEMRNLEAYQILKHYHLVETNEELLEKIETIVNILIRKEGSEIEVDDLLDGLGSVKVTTGDESASGNATAV